jgi:hypothetical protein
MYSITHSNSDSLDKMVQFGASFSARTARDFGMDPRECLSVALEELQIKRLRLMSYWDIHEAKKGIYDFTELDWQIQLAEKYGADVTLAIGLRQPRWPESHWPDWAKTLPDSEWQQALYAYIEQVVNRYKSKKCIISWQLENEALLKNFGTDGNFDRRRLQKEFMLVKRLDPSRPVIMSTSDSWGIPWHNPRPDTYAFSIYRYFFDRGKYRRSRRPPQFYWLRAQLIRLVSGRKVFIHELQAEPWGPTGTHELPLEEQFISMDLAKVKQAVEFARKTLLLPADLWGMEWWYYLKTRHNRPEIWEYIKAEVFSNAK